MSAIPPVRTLIVDDEPLARRRLRTILADEPGIEIIGEAAAHLTETTRQAVRELPFRKMRGMRNIVAYDYANVDLKIVWEVATVHVSEICAVLEKFFASQC